LIDGLPQNESKQANQKPAFAFQGQQRFYAFLPEPDITAFELAEIVGFLPAAILSSLNAFPPAGVDSLMEAMSDGAKRHFQAKKKSGLVLPQRVNGR
jgi:hypothetical protein